MKATNTPKGVAKRTRIILLAHKGKSGKAIGQQLKVRQPTIRLWKARFLAGGPPALRKIALGRDRKPSLSRRKVAAVVRATIHAKPKGPTHWSCRSMARAKGLSFKSGPRIWKLHGLKPQGGGLVRGWEEPDSGAGSHATRLAAQEGPRRHAHP